MFGKMMNSFYYGKSGKGDYRKEDLPQNRWQLFWEMLKIRLSGLCRLNLMYVVIWLPFLFVLFQALSEWLNITLAIAEQQDMVAQAALAGEEALQTIAHLEDAIKALVLRTLVYLIPCIAITGPVTAGAAYVARNWARDEHAFIWSDFRDAIKENWKQALAVSAITSVIPLVLYVCWMFYGEMAEGNILFLLPQVLSASLGLLWLCALLYLYPLMVTYRLSFMQLLRNGLLLAVGRLPMTAGLKLLSLVPVLLAVAVALFVGVQWAFIGALLYYLLIGYSLSRFVGASYANAVFDKYINPNIEGASVGQGLYQKDEDDLEEDAWDEGEEPSSRG